MVDSTVNRWRMILGKYSKKRFPSELGREEERMDRALDFLYGREYGGRGVWGGARGGSLDPTQLAVPDWIKEVKRLFPRETFRIIEKHALEKYGLTDLVLDKESLVSLEPNRDLLKVILTFKGRMKPDVLEEARKIVRTIVKELAAELSSCVRRAFSGTPASTWTLTARTRTRSSIRTPTTRCG